MKKEHPHSVQSGRRQFIRSGVISAAVLLSPDFGKLLHAAQAPPWRFQPQKPIIPAPGDPASWPAYREQLASWRQTTLHSIHYDDALYRRPEFAWAASAYSCCFLMMCDETFYDQAAGRYTVDALLDDGAKEFGGYDSVVLWHAYPRIGVDQRNQFDFYRDMPGGLQGVREAVRTFHKRGVYVYIDYNPWDTGTRRDPKGDLETLAALVREIEVDGIFLDTMKEGAAAFRQKLDAARPGVVLEGEGTPPVNRLQDHHASWAQWFDDSEVPGVLSLKWLERRHMQHQVSRWSSSHARELQTAWMNGSGMMVWENVFGSWLPWNAHDRSLLRTMLPIHRRYAALFRGEGWTPLVPVEMPEVYASLWQGEGVRLWTIVNRGDREAAGNLLKVDAVPGQRFYDLVAGTELKPAKEAGQMLLNLDIPPQGVGCVLAASPQQLGPGFGAFLAGQAALQSRVDLNAVHPHRDTVLKPVARTAKVIAAPEGMMTMPSRAPVSLNIQMRVREDGYYESQVPDEEQFRASSRYQTREFIRAAPTYAFAVDETPVTNAQYALFLKASGYKPRYAENFLRHWTGGTIPPGKQEHPVVWVDQGDARAYAGWAGKRLPTEEEWQLAAQGEHGLEYPWGGGIRAGVCNLGETGDTTPVKQFPAGRSPVGCLDMCGNVWQWTESERTDGRTRFSIIRGGSYFTATGSNWYVEGGPRPANFATKFLHMWPGLDRCSTIGFRCVVDLASQA